MARQNYQHGKRQRELAKKQKQDEKLQRKLERKNNPHPEADDSTMPVEGDGSALESATEESEGEP